MRKLFITAIFLSLFVCLTASSVDAHDNANIGMSTWTLEKNQISITLWIEESYFKQLKELGSGKCRLESETDMKQVIHEVIQPYTESKISVRINETQYPVKVDGIRLVEKEAALYFEVSAHADGIVWSEDENKVKFEYRFLMDESKNLHANVAEVIIPGSHGGIQHIFTSSTPVWEGAVKRALFVDRSTVSPADVSADPITIADPGVPGMNDRSVEGTPLWRSAFSFVLLGIKHILIGYDHILFLLALLVVGLTFKGAVRIITSFTIAHSITLFLAATGIVSLRTYFVESAIALSICWLAYENIVRKRVIDRWRITFVFGLIHGFGFANVLQTFLVAKSTLLISVVFFNVGVEIGQCIIFLVVLPVMILAHKKLEARKLTVAVSFVIMAFGLFWLLERLGGYQL
jgi:hypothetical protein